MENGIYHYGVKGMRWGIRRNRKPKRAEILKARERVNDVQVELDSAWRKYNNAPSRGKKFMEAEELVSKKQKEYLDTVSTASLRTGRERATALLGYVGGMGLSAAVTYFLVNG